MGRAELAAEREEKERYLFLSSSLLSLTLSFSSSHSSSPAPLSLSLLRRKFPSRGEISFSLFFSSFSHSLLLFLTFFLACASLSLSRDGNFRRREERFFSLFFSSFSHSLLLFLTFFLACASLSLSFATEIPVARRDFFFSLLLFFLSLSPSLPHFLPRLRISLSSSFLSLTLSFSSSLSFSCASLSLSRDGNFRGEERFLSLFSLFFGNYYSLSSFSRSPLLPLCVSQRKFSRRETRCHVFVHVLLYSLSLHLTRSSFLSLYSLSTVYVPLLF